MTSCATSARPVLAINCAEERLQVVLGTDAALLFNEEVHCPGQSIRHLPTAVARALRVHDLSTSDLAGIACVRGPGSFTGLRIAHAAMYGLARPFSTPMAGLPYLELLATQAGRLTAREIRVLTYARKGQVYMQGFFQDRPLDSPRAMSAAQARELLASRPGPICLLGSGLRRNPVLAELPGARILPEVLDTPLPATLLAAARAATFTTTPPAPLYLRKSDAEDNLEAIAQARGIPAAEARQHIPDFE